MEELSNSVFETRNYHVDAVYEAALQCLPDIENPILFSEDSVVDNGGTNASRFPEEFLNKINQSGLPVHALKLKV